MRRLTEEKLQERLLELKREQMNLRFRAAAGDGAGAGRMRTARREAARALTVLHEMRRGAKA